MKNLFPGYYRKSDEEIKKMWESGIIAIDANVLLNLYKYSDSTQKTMLELITKLSDKIYLPHQAALEYCRNRYEVIVEQEKAYKEFLDKITQIQKDLQSNNKPPFLSKEVDNELNITFKKVIKEVNENIKKYSAYLQDDPIFNKISDLFKDSTTESFTDEELAQIFKEGEERYKNKIPPGFEDEKTKENNKKFGDLILWKQIIKKAKELKKDVILITDDSKIDWWWKIKDGRNMGPRQELVEEIKSQANVDFHMYSSEKFLSYGQQFLKQKINQQALDEIKAMKKSHAEDVNIYHIFTNQQNRFIHNSNTEIIDYNKEIEELDKKIAINTRTIEIIKSYVKDDDDNEALKYLENYNSKLIADRNAKMEEFNSSQNLFYKFITKNYTSS